MSESMQEITAEWLSENGFRRQELLGYVLRLSEGPGDTVAELVAGNYPFNVPQISLMVGGFCLGTGAETRDDILFLIRMFDRAPIDHPDEMDVDADFFDED